MRILFALQPDLYDYDNKLKYDNKDPFVMSPEASHISVKNGRTRSLKK